MPPKINKDECTGCGTCAEECPVEAIIIVEDEGCAVIDDEECVECGTCEDVCPTGSIKADD